MTQLVATLLPSAIAFALSPIAIIELILVLFSKRRVANALAFVLALVVLTASVLLVGAQGARAADAGASSGPSPLLSAIFIGLALMLLVISARNWQNRSDTSEPAVLSAIAEMGPGAVAFLALGATWLNPKNAVLLLGAGGLIGSAPATTSPWLMGLVFLLVATAPYTAVATYSLAGGQSAAARLDTLRTWLIARNRLIVAIITGLLGAVLLLKGLAGLG